MSEQTDRNTIVPQHIANLVFIAANESRYPIEWQAWKNPIQFYIFEVADGNVDADQMHSLGNGWWLASNNEIQEIDCPHELLPTCPDQGRLLLPHVSFLVQREKILICEKYLDKLGIRRRYSLTDFKAARRINDLPEIWRIEF